MVVEGVDFMLDALEGSLWCTADGVDGVAGVLSTGFRAREPDGADNDDVGAAELDVPAGAVTVGFSVISGPGTADGDDELDAGDVERSAGGEDAVAVEGTAGGGYAAGVEATTRDVPPVAGFGAALTGASCVGPEFDEGG